MDDGEETLIDRLHKAAGQHPALKELLLETAEELQEMDTLFEMTWAANMRGVRRWRAANPGNELTLPDQGDLVVWLLNRLDQIDPVSH